MQRSVSGVPAADERREENLRDVVLVDLLVAVVVVELHDDRRHHHVGAERRDNLPAPRELELRRERAAAVVLALLQTIDGPAAVGARVGRADGRLGHALAALGERAALAAPRVGHRASVVVAERVVTSLVGLAVARVDARSTGRYALLERAHRPAATARVAARERDVAAHVAGADAAVLARRAVGALRREVLIRGAIDARVPEARVVETHAVVGRARGHEGCAAAEGRRSNKEEKTVAHRSPRRWGWSLESTSAFLGRRVPRLRARHMEECVI